MSQPPKVKDKRESRKRGQEEFTVTFTGMEAFEHAVYPAEIRLIMVYFADVLQEMYGEKKEGQNESGTIRKG